MIATVRFFAEERVQEDMLMGDVRFAAMHERTGEILVSTGAWVEFMEFVGGVWCRSEEGVEEACQFW